MLQMIRRFSAPIKALLGMEGAERMSYYSMRSICVIFLTTVWGIESAKAEGITQSNIALLYLLTVAGAFLADFILGQFLTAAGFGLLCCLGHLTLSLAVQYDSLSFLHPFFSDKLMAYQAGLLLIGLGAGGLKPANSGLFGNQFEKENLAGMDQGWRVFYFSINIGAFIGQMSTPWISLHFGYDLGFGFAGIMMLISVSVLLFHRRRLVRVAPAGFPKNNFFSVNFRALRLRLTGTREVFQSGALQAFFPGETISETLNIWKALAFFALYCTLTQGIYEFNGVNFQTDWQLTDKMFLGVQWEAGQINTVNSILVLLFTPLAVFGFDYLRRTRGRELSLKKRMILGSVLIALGIAVEAVFVDRLAVMPQLPGAWQVLAIFVLSIGEVLFMISGLEAGFAFGGVKSKSTMMSLWYLSTALGNFITSRVSYLKASGQPLEFLSHGGNYYWFFLGLLALNYLLIFFLALRNSSRRLN